MGQTRPGSLDRRGETDEFTVSLETGTRYRIEVALDSLADSVLALIGPGGGQVAANDDISDTHLGSRIDHTAEFSGTYTIVVAGYDGRATGSYRLA